MSFWRAIYKNLDQKLTQSPQAEEGTVAPYCIQRKAVIFPEKVVSRISPIFIEAQ